MRNARNQWIIKQYQYIVVFAKQNKTKKNYLNTQDSLETHRETEIKNKLVIDMIDD